MTGADRPLTMLMVEDNSADIYFFREALKETALPVVLHVVTDGRSGMEFLCREGAFAGAPRPDVVVLDLNLPIMNGHEVLIRMMSSPDFRNIPVAILTTSTSDMDVCELCPPGRCLYITKTDDFRRLQEIIRTIVRHAVIKTT